MKRSLRIMAIAGVAVILTAVVVLIPKLRNMESEYATARAIGDLKEYPHTHDAGGRSRRTILVAGIPSTAASTWTTR